MSMVKAVCSMLSVISLSLVLLGDLHAASYQHSLTIDKMTFDWSIEGERIAIKLSAPTKGWVGVGFHPTEKMKGANIILGFVKDGKVEITNQYGVQTTRHAPYPQQNSKESITVAGGNETGNTTTLEFSVPLRSQDPDHGTIDPKSDTVMIFAYGPDWDSTKLKHQFAKTVTVNLENGTMK